MTLATYVEMPAPRRAVEGRTDDLLPAELTVAFGAGDAAIPGSVPLHDFLRTAGTLTHAERMVIVGQALLMLEGNYVHLPLKSAMHAVNPVQRLRLLRARLLRQTDATMDPERTFHTEMSAIFHSVRDLHTNYLLPQPFAGMIAYLPFQVERCTDGGRTSYVVTRLAQGLSAPTFGVGVEITHWNGMPVDRAVAVNADRFAGSNAAARLVRGVDSLTVRSLRLHLPPDEEWVTVSYLDAQGVRRELREPWLVAPNAPAMADAEVLTTAAASMGLDLHADETGRARALLYAPRAVEQQALGDAAVELSTEPAEVGGEVPSTMPLVFRARSVATAAGTFAHLRVFTFNVPDPAAFVAEFVRLVELLPQDGLILDVRGNGGGHILASEFTLQTLTPRRITPEPVQFVCTPLNLEICRRHEDNPTDQIDLGPWFPSLDQSVETGAIYSSAFPITPEDGANRVGQRYFGPVVLVTDARCYSATDIFAAGFQDHAIGPVLGVDDNTGAGGANVWTHGLLKALRDVPADPGSPYVPLPKQADMRVSIRRTLRVGALAGTPVEDLGVRPDVRHEMTRRDVLHGNADLLDAAGALLAGRPLRRLGLVTATQDDGTLDLQLTLAGIDRVDVYVDGRPRGSRDVADGTTSFAVPDGAGAGVVQVQGFAAGVLVAARTETL
ncbi:S41 family peptidase [Blastococcus haudaquaticus]|uniref:Peptidase family S41 n=1 Tax=Blastococcus haudaquaticus TaxID=1938745 RepID=A0A286GRX6_9ACTN|nr:S41 family peptidase [Blastococcus haudaquaticus]SOD98278.1 Peptidase family S41 [Blastococcus haudaquaticus]